MLLKLKGTGGEEIPPSASGVSVELLIHQPLNMITPCFTYKGQPIWKIPVHQTTEVTQTAQGGTSCFSLQPTVMKRYYITAEHRSAFLGQLQDVINGNKDSGHNDLQRSRIKQDQDAVSRVADIIQGSNNPFTVSQQGLVSISTPKAPPKEVATDLQKAHERW